MAKNNNKIGGWLRCFQELIWFDAIAMALKIIFMLVALFSKPLDIKLAHYLFSIVALFFMSLYSFKIVAQLQRKVRDTPQRVVRQYIALFFLVLVVSVLDIVFAAASYGLEIYFQHFDAQVLFFLAIYMVSFFVWPSYFKRSRRVRFYYGCNAS